MKVYLVYDDYGYDGISVIGICSNLEYACYLRDKEKHNPEEIVIDEYELDSTAKPKTVYEGRK